MNPWIFENDIFTQIFAKVVHRLDTVELCFIERPHTLVIATVCGKLQFPHLNVHNPVSHNFAINPCHTSTAIYHI